MVTGIFVDIAKHFHSVLNIDRRARIDYERYLSSALGEETLHRAFAYGVQINEEANDFIFALKRIGYEPRYKQIAREERPNIRQTSWLVGMSMDVVRNIRFLDHIILGFNDPDLIPLIQWIKEKGVRVTIYSMNIHKELMMAADECREIESNIFIYKETNELDKNS